MTCKRLRGFIPELEKLKDYAACYLSLVTCYLVKVAGFKLQGDILSWSIDHVAGATALIHGLVEAFLLELVHRSTLDISPTVTVLHVEKHGDVPCVLRFVTAQFFAKSQNNQEA